MELTHTAGHPGRLSDFLKKEMGVSTGLMNRLKWHGGILVNGKPEHTDYPVQPGDRISLLLDDPTPQYPAEDVPITILYEDPHLLAVDKAPGILIHPSRARNDGTLANFVAGYFARTGQNCAFHPITRLDRDTFGIVLLAKNAHVHALMNQLHDSGQIRKTYHALVFGGPEQDSGTINAPIARKPLPSLLREVRPDGKPSVTQYQVLERGGGCARMSLRPVTGRTHQLRLHCAFCGYPILGDPQYGSPESQAFSAGFGFESQQLCAHTLEFPHPITGQPLCLSSQLDVVLPALTEGE